jgi:hypothetical protein
MRCWHPWFRIYPCALVYRAYGLKSMKWTGYICLEEVCPGE